MAKVYLTRRATFSASHRLHQPQLTTEENVQLFGKCHHIHGHGHNYVLEITVQGEIDSTGIIINLIDLKKIIEEKILIKVDHKHLNLDVKEFELLNPTAENMVVVFWNWLQESLSHCLYEVKLHETENNTATYRGE